MQAVSDPLDPVDVWAYEAQLSWPQGWTRDFACTPDELNTSDEDFSDGVPDRLDTNTMPSKPAPIGTKLIRKVKR